tara:strand:- start:5082 stop:6128 length:1047 start_codon:yes stop_codon:yes gene_type:complete
MSFKSLFNQKNINTNKPFVIAEIGHNHKGSVEIAKKLFLSAKDCGADAVKLQKRDNKFLYTDEFYNEPYNSENSYGKTYGKHRDHLEFNKKEYLELIKYAKKIGIEFLCTPFDFNSIKFLQKIKIKAYKIASADLINIPLVIEIAKTKKPIFLSTGGGNFKDIDRAVKCITKINKKLAILHCTASYPVNLEDMNLNVIKELKKKYSNYLIGLSDHENGIDAAPLAYMLGARVFEKHFTLDRSWKGTDHAFSLEPIGLSKLIRNLNRITIILGRSNKKFLASEKKPLFKMHKSIVANKDLKKGKKLIYSDLAYKSPGGGLKPYEYKKLINKIIKKDITKDQKLSFKDLK